MSPSKFPQMKGGIFTNIFLLNRAIKFYDIFQRQDKPLDKAEASYYIEGLDIPAIINSFPS